MFKSKPINNPHFNNLCSKDPSKRYHIKNTTTSNTLITSDDLMFIKQRYYHIPKRKHSTLILLDTETGEILKSK